MRFPVPSLHSPPFHHEDVDQRDECDQSAEPCERAKVKTPPGDRGEDEKGAETEERKSEAQVEGRVRMPHRAVRTIARHITCLPRRRANHTRSRYARDRPQAPWTKTVDRSASWTDGEESPTWPNPGS